MKSAELVKRERLVERALKELWKQVEAKQCSAEKKAQIVYEFMKIRDLLIE